MAEHTAGNGRVSISVPSSADHVSLLRTLVGFYAAREDFTLDEVDDLRMAVEEAAVQLLRRTIDDHLHLVVSTSDGQLQAELTTAVRSDQPLMDETSLSWIILSALADDLSVSSQDGSAVVRMTKQRSTTSSSQEVG